MDIQEVQDEILKLETDIIRLLGEFSNKTSVYIDNLELNLHETTSFKCVKRTYLYNVRCSAKLTSGRI